MPKKKKPKSKRKGKFRKEWESTWPKRLLDLIEKTILIFVTSVCLGVIGFVQQVLRHWFPW